MLEERIERFNIKAKVVPYCAEIEEMVMSMGDEGSVYSEMNNFESALPEIIHAGYEILNLMQYFTVGQDEVRAWPVRVGASAPEAAGCIHTDFEKAFQTVEVTKYEEFLTHKKENPTFKPLKMAKFGKKYIVEDGDILQFMVCYHFFSIHLIIYDYTNIIFTYFNQIDNIEKIIILFLNFLYCL